MRRWKLNKAWSLGVLDWQSCWSVPGLLGQDLSAFKSIKSFHIVVSHPVILQSLWVSKELCSCLVSHMVARECCSSNGQPFSWSQLSVLQVHCQSRSEGEQGSKAGSHGCELGCDSHHSALCVEDALLSQKVPVRRCDNLIGSLLSGIVFSNEGSVPRVD